MNNWYYFLILGSAVVVPLLVSFHPIIGLRNQFASVMKAIFFTAPLFIIWDVIFTGLGVWGFNAKYHAGVLIMGLPIEEILFFVCIPFCCLFTYHALGRVGIGSAGLWPRFAAILISVSCFSLSLVYHERLYTFMASLSCAVVFGWAAILNPPFLKQFIYTFVILTVPFLLVNGALTGTFTADPVVWYSPDGIIGKRLFTIPLEDFIYSALMIFMNIAVYERAKPRMAAGKPAAIADPNLKERIT